MSALTEVPVVVMRGGTSRGLFFHERDLPPPGAVRDRVLNDLMGSPDPLQVDGLGGTYSSNSKVIVVAGSEEPGVDVEYEFGQVAVGRRHIDYRGNCGNLTAAVAPFAIQEGLIEGREPTTRVVLLNRNTGVRVVATVPFADGRVGGAGELRGETNDAIGLSFLDPGGAVCGATLPTGNAVDRLPWRESEVEVSIVDVTSPVVFVLAGDLGLTADEAPARINDEADTLAAVERLRGRAAHLLGFVSRSLDASASSPSQPKLAICAAGTGDGDPTLVARIFSMGRMHHTFTLTGLLCFAAAAQIPGTIPHVLARGAGPRIVVAHAGGSTEVAANVGVDHAGSPQVTDASVLRTARTILRGTAYLPPAPVESDHAGEPDDMRRPS